MEHGPAHLLRPWVLDVGIPARAAHHAAEREAGRRQQLPQRRRQQDAAAREGGDAAERGLERRHRPEPIELRDDQGVAEQPVPAGMTSRHHAGDVDSCHGGKHRPMAVEHDPARDQGVDRGSRRRRDLSRQKAIEGGNQHAKPWHHLDSSGTPEASALLSPARRSGRWQTGMLP